MTKTINSVSELKIGDKVRVRADLVVGEYYDRWAFVGSMAHLAGQEVTVIEVGSDIVRLEEDNLRNGFTAEMLEPIRKPIRETINVPHMSGMLIMITKIIISEPAVIVFYLDPNGKEKKSVAKCDPRDEFDADLGIQVAIMKAIRRLTDKFFKTV